jgi:hypothetical protein
VGRSLERAGRLKGQKCGSLAAIYATLGCSAASCLNSCGEIKLTLNNTAAKRPPTSVAAFCKYLRARQNATRQFDRCEVSFNSRRRVAESKLGKQVRRIHSDQRLRPFAYVKSYNLKSDLCQQAYDFDTLYHLQNSLLARNVTVCSSESLPWWRIQQYDLC